MPVVNRLYPRPYESLESLLARVWHANYYTSAPEGWRGALLPRVSASANLLGDPAHLGPLGDFTGLAERTLRDCTVHRFAPSYLWPEDGGAADAAGDDPPPWRPVDRAPFLEQGQGKVCPLCWRERKILLLPWMLSHITTCPTHRVLLVDRCDGCGTKLRFSLSQGTCRACGRDIGALVARPLDGHPPSLRLTAALWSLVGCGPSFPPPAAGVPVGHPLRGLHPATVLLFLWVTGAAGAFSYGGGVSWACWQREFSGYELRQRYADVGRAHAALVDLWEQTLHAPEARAAWAAYSAETEVIRAIKVRHAGQGGQDERSVGASADPAWSWLLGAEGWDARDGIHGRLARDETVYQRVRQWRLCGGDGQPYLPPLLTQRAATAHLRAGCYALRRRARDHDRGTDHARALRPDWGDDAFADQALSVAVDEMAAQCGVAADDAPTLVAAGLLHAERVDGGAGPPRYGISAAAIASFHAWYRPLGARPRDELLALVTLPRALDLLRADGLRAAQALVAVRTGRLPTYRFGDDRAGPALWVSLAELHAYAASTRWAQHAPRVSAADVRRTLHCPPAALRQLYAEGLLVPAADDTDLRAVRWSYAVYDVDVFAYRYLTVAAVATLLEMTVGVVRRLIATGRLRPVLPACADGRMWARFDRNVACDLWDALLTRAAVADLVSGGEGERQG